MPYITRAFLLLLCLLVLSSCSRRDTALYNNTTVSRHVDLDRNKRSQHRKLDKGVYLFVERNSGGPRKKLLDRLVLNAAKLTIKKGYKNFVVLQDHGGDRVLQEAMDHKRIRKELLSRLEVKSSQKVRTRILVKKRYQIVLSNEMFAIILMLKKGKYGLPAKKVKYVIENGLHNTFVGNDALTAFKKRAVGRFDFEKELKKKKIYRKVY